MRLASDLFSMVLTINILILVWGPASVMSVSVTLLQLPPQRTRKARRMDCGPETVSLDHGGGGRWKDNVRMLPAQLFPVCLLCAVRV